MASKQLLGFDVLQAAKSRISKVFDDFPNIYISFSGGKDSSVLTHLVMSEAIRRNRKVAVLFIDLEAQYRLTIEHVSDIFQAYKANIEPYWVALPLSLRNAVSQYQPQWQCWDPDEKDVWVRLPPEGAITDNSYFPFFERGMEFEEFVEEFGAWYGAGDLTACFVGIRCTESLNRQRAILSQKKQRYGDYAWTTWKGRTLYNAYPLYDWNTRDIWVYNGKYSASYNKLYDLMHKAGLSIHQQRICQPYGDDQRKGLWLFHLIEPFTWSKIVARVNGANQGSLYARESGNITGNIKVSKPDSHTWESFAELLIESMPDKTAEHYRNKIAVFLKWYSDRGYPNGIPDEAAPSDEAAKKVPSWRRICKMLLRNDYWGKGLSFTQHKSAAYQKYLKLMKRRRREWGIM